MRLLAGLLLIATPWIVPGVAAADPSPTPPVTLGLGALPGEIREVVDGWKSSPVYVDPSQRSLFPESEATRLADRANGHEPAIRIAVVPAAVLSELPGNGTREQAAREFVDQVVDLQQVDGIYLVVFGGSLTWGSAVGVDTPIAEILTDELGKHSRSDPVGTLDGV